MRKQFFTKLDSLLPRFVARVPYDSALVTIKALLGSKLGVKVWNRNSTRTGSFVVGISDLDITVLFDEKLDFAHLVLILKKLKTIFIFLGETNLYMASHLPFILPRMNSFELKRDPELLKMDSLARTFDDVEKFVFTQRMLFSDAHTLLKNPEYRQPKWKYHFELLGIEAPKKIEIPFVVEVLKKLSGNNPRIIAALDSWQAQFHQPGFDMYRAKLGEGFKILAPQCHVWFQAHEDRVFMQTLTDLEKEIIKRQIDWEVWGLYTQKYQPDQNTVREHLRRLSFAYRYAAGDQEFMRLEKEISLVFGV